MSPTTNSPGASTRVPSARPHRMSVRGWAQHLTRQQQPPASPSSPAQGNLTPQQQATLTQAQALERLKQNQRARRQGNPETPIVNACLQTLAVMGLRDQFWRENTVGLAVEYKTKSGEKRRGFVHPGRVGKSDILGCWRGLFVAIEVKQPGEQPSPEQWAFLRMVEAQGGIAVVAHSASEMKNRLDQEFAARTPAGDVTARARQFTARMPRFVAIVDREAHQAVQQLFEEALSKR